MGEVIVDHNGQNGESHTTSEGTSTSITENNTITKPSSPSFWRRAYGILTWTPPSCRWDPENPTKLTLPLNFLFGFAATFTVANLYYNHPLLSVFSQDFHVTQERASIIPTAAQAGYASGLFLLCPLGDLIKRRPLVLVLNLVTATLTLGVCLTKTFNVFVALQFIMSCTTVTPQLMLPLVGELAPPGRRATALSIVVSSMMFGMLIARLLSGIIANYSSWRNVYWMSFGLQYAIWILLWLFMPDYPRSNSDISYPRILWSILEYLVRTPLLVQTCLMGFFTSATFTNFWTTLTFLLSGEPYNYSTVVIGLFALAGIGTMTAGPFISRYFIDKFQPCISVLLGQIMVLVAITISTYSGTHTIVGPIIQAIFGDMGLQVAQIANRTAIYAIAIKASNRVNTAYMLAVFCGQLMGTAAGNHLYAQGGWVLSGSASVGFVGAAIIICLLRGPFEKGWIGWHGGWTWRRLPKVEPPENTTEQEVIAPSVVEEQEEKGSPSALSTAEKDATRHAGDVQESVDVEKGESGAEKPSTGHGLSADSTT